MALDGQEDCTHIDTDKVQKHVFDALGKRDLDSDLLTTPILRYYQVTLIGDYSFPSK